MNKSTNTKDEFDPVLHSELWTILKRHWGEISEADTVEELTVYINSLLAKDRQQLIQRIREEVIVKPNTLPKTNQLEGVKQGINYCIKKQRQILETMENE